MAPQNSAQLPTLACSCAVITTGETNKRNNMLQDTALPTSSLYCVACRWHPTPLSCLGKRKARAGPADHLGWVSSFTITVIQCLFSKLRPPTMVDLLFWRYLDQCPRMGSCFSVWHWSAGRSLPHPSYAQRDRWVTVVLSVHQYRL